MVFRSGRMKPHHDGTGPYDGLLSCGARAVIDLVDVVGNVRDGEHLQYLVFLAQEFGLLAEPVFLFGSMGPDPRRPHSLLLEDHFYMLLRDGIIDLDGGGPGRPGPRGAAGPAPSDPRAARRWCGRRRRCRWGP